jgi:hypothetical protein
MIIQILSAALALHKIKRLSSIDQKITTVGGWHG